MTNIEKKNFEDLFIHAEKLRNSGNLLESIKILTKIYKKIPNNKAVSNSLANCYFQLNKLDLAEKYYLICLKIDPINLQTLNNLSLLHLRNKNFNNALTTLHRSLEINNDQENIIEKIGYCLIQIKLYLDANKFCKKYLKKYPNNSFLLEYYEKSCFSLGKNIEGLKTLQKQTGFIQFDEDEVKLI